MDTHTITLLKFEFQMLLESLRRDMHTQLLKAESNEEHTDIHLINSRRTKRLLEVLNPRSNRNEKQNNEVPRLIVTLP